MFYKVLSVLVIGVLCQMNMVTAAEQLKFWDPKTTKLEEARRQQHANVTSPASTVYVTSPKRNQTSEYSRLSSLAKVSSGHTKSTTPITKTISNHRRIGIEMKKSQNSKEQLDNKTKLNLEESRRFEGHSVHERINPYEIFEQMSKLAPCFPQANIKIEKMGRTAEYKDLILLRISHQKVGFRAGDKYEEDVPEKKYVFIVHGLSPKGMNIYHDNPTSLVKIDTLKMLFKYYFKHLKNFDIMLVPLANPDAVLTQYDFWDKNISPQRNCLGVNLDRNFDVKFNSSHKINSCSQLYPGPYAFSELETRAIRDIFNKYGHKIIAYLHVHYGTYKTSILKGDAVLYPKGYSETNTDDDKYIDLRGEIDEAIKNATFQHLGVAVETLYNWYGNVTGTSVDYASTIFGIPYSMEFVMQQYADDVLAQSDDTKLSYVALKDVWKRIIDVTFNNIYKYTQNSETRRLNLLRKKTNINSVK